MPSKSYSYSIYNQNFYTPSTYKVLEDGLFYPLPAEIGANDVAVFVTFIRHAEGWHNMHGHLLHFARDPDLTEKGWQQALNATAHLNSRQFDLIVCSPMRRTLRSLEIAFSTHIEKGVPVVIHPWCCENTSDKSTQCDKGTNRQQLQEQFQTLAQKLFPGNPALFLNDLPEQWWTFGNQVRSTF